MLCLMRCVKEESPVGRRSESFMLGGLESPFCTGGGGCGVSVVRRTGGCHRTTSNRTGFGTGSRTQMLGQGKCAHERKVGQACCWLLKGVSFT